MVRWGNYSLGFVTGFVLGMMLTSLMWSYMIGRQIHGQSHVLRTYDIPHEQIPPYASDSEEYLIDAIRTECERNIVRK
jgi:hypothetical protein